MTQESAEKYLYDISYELGTVAMKYMTEETGVKMREAIETLTAPHLDEWCEDCREYDKENHSCPRFNKVIKQTVEEVRCNTCIHSDEQTGENCYECVKGIVDRYESNSNSMYVVSYHDNEQDEAVVTVFDNKVAAVKCFKEFSKIHSNLAIDEVPVYSTFTSDTKMTNHEYLRSIDIREFAKHIAAWKGWAGTKEEVDYCQNWLMKEHD